MKAAWKVLMAMSLIVSPGGTESIYRQLIPYKRDISFEYDGSMSMVQQYLERNRTYIRLGSEEFF